MNLQKNMSTPSFIRSRVGSILSAILITTLAQAEDWPHWRGPTYNGISAEKGIADTWPEGGPKSVWKAKIGLGFSGISVQNQRAVTVGHADDRDTVWCFNADNGEVVWKHSYDSDLGDKYFDGGPTGTPSMRGDVVVVLSRWGDVFCLDAATGKVRWSKNVQKETGARIPDWGFSGSPLLLGELAILNVGSGGVALKLSDGSIAWRSKDQEAGYSTALPTQVKNQPVVLLASGKSYAAIHSKTGEEIWRFPWPTQYGVNAADPILDGDRVLISSGYGQGAALIAIGEGTPKVVWQNKNLRTQMNPGVLIQGHVYGIDGDTTTKATLKCINVQTGEVRWTEAGIGSGSVVGVGSRLLVLTDRGELIWAPAVPEGFKPLARAQVLGGKCWTAPTLANGKVYCRNAAGNLVCVDVRGAQPAK